MPKVYIPCLTGFTMPRLCCLCGQEAQPDDRTAVRVYEQKASVYRGSWAESAGRDVRHIESLTLNFPRCRRCYQIETDKGFVTRLIVYNAFCLMFGFAFFWITQGPQMKGFVSSALGMALGFGGLGSLLLGAIRQKKIKKRYQREFHKNYVPVDDRVKLADFNTIRGETEFYFENETFAERFSELNDGSFRP